MGVSVGIGVLVGGCVGVMVGVRVMVEVLVGNGVAVGGMVRVGRGVQVGCGVQVSGSVALGTAVLVGRGVRVRVMVGVLLGVKVRLGVGVEVGGFKIGGKRRAPNKTSTKDATPTRATSRINSIACPLSTIRGASGPAEAGALDCAAGIGGKSAASPASRIRAVRAFSLLGLIAKTRRR